MSTKINEITDLPDLEPGQRYYVRTGMLGDRVVNEHLVGPLELMVAGEVLAEPGLVGEVYLLSAYGFTARPMYEAIVECSPDLEDVDRAEALLGSARSLLVVAIGVIDVEAADE